jgi:DNA-binding MarR family transcriptional regulator
MKREVVGEDRAEIVSFIQELDPNIDPQAVRLMDQMHHVSHSLLRIGETSLADSGLSLAKYRILMSLMMCEKTEGKVDLNPSEISLRQGTSRNTISSLISDLEEEKLVNRRLDLNDRRKFNIRLTELGREKVNKHAGSHLGAIAKIFGVLTAEEQEKLSRLLSKLERSARDQITG